MIPLFLELHNFMSYRGTCAVDWRGVRVACLSGNNGAGKSALLDAMTWALWGKSRAKSDRDLITLGEAEMRVDFEFQLGGQHYKILRARSGSSLRLTLELYIRRVDGGWEPLTGDNASETQHNIDALIRMDYETFTNSAFLLQGKADAFTQKTPGDRKRILGEILGLDQYDELASLAREHEREARQRVSLQRERIEQLDQQIGEEQRLGAELEDANRAVQKLEEDIARLERERRDVATEVELLKAIEATRDRAVTRRQTLISERKQVANRLTSDERSLTSARRIIQQAGDIEQGYQQLTAARAERDRLADVLRRRRPIEELIARLTNEIEREQRRIEHENQRRQDRRRQLLDRLQVRDSAASELKKAISETKTLEREMKSLGEPESERARTQEEIGKLTAERKALRIEMDDIVARIAAIDNGQATCPICRRPLAEGDHEHIRALWEQDGKKLGDRYRAHKRRIDELKTELAELDKRAQALEKHRTRHTRLSATIEQFERTIAEAETLDDEIKAIDAEIESAQEALDRGDFAAEQRAQLTAAQAELTTMPYDAGEHQRAQERTESLEPFENRRQELLQARERESNLVAMIDDRKARLSAIDGELKSIDAEIEEHHNRLERADETRRRFREIEIAYQELTESRAQATESRAVLQASLNQITEAREERKRSQAEVRRLSKDADAYRELTAAFGRNGIQAMIINTVLPEIQDEANALLRRMSSSMLEVRLSTSRLGRTGQTIDTLDITIHDEYGQRPYEMYSGGEAFRIDFAIRVALSRLLARRAGATIDMLVIDEGFGTQDSRGRDGLVEALHSVESDFDMILVITHIDEIRDMFPTRLDIIKTADGSRVTVN